MSTNEILDGTSDTGGEKKLTHKQKVKLRRKLRDESNPCLEEEKDCLRCKMDVEQRLSPQFCKEAYLNYTNCFKFWNNVKKDRSKRGIEPALPAPADREHVRQQYFSKWGSGKFNTFQWGS